MSVDNYIRPIKTYTDQLDENDIEDKLNDYIKVEDITQVKIKTHVRYFSLEMDKKSGTMKRLFRMGGFITKIDANGQYIVLSNGRSTWTVQIAKSVFYRKLSTEEIKDEYEREIEKLQLINKKLYKQNRKLIAKLEELGYVVQ